MSTANPSGADAAVNAFLLDYLEDEEAGRERTLSEYQSLHPGFEQVIAAEHRRLTGSGTAEEDRAGQSESAVARFEAAWQEDLANGHARAFAEYLREYPGAELVIAERCAQLASNPDNTGTSTGLGAANGAGIGERFGSYLIESELGRGGQGAVYLAHDERMDRPVALKVLTGLALGSPEALLRFRREASVASRIDHPGVCTVYESDAIDGVPYVAMRYVEGETLAHRLARLRRVQVTSRHAGSGGPDRDELMRMVAILERAALAVHAAHERGVVHRDLNPNNLMIESDDRPVVLDFGLARDLMVEGSGLTHTGDVFGTPSYMAPEQLREGDRTDRRTDVYSLGVTLFECVTLRRPFEGPTRDRLYRQILSEPMPDPRALNREVSTDLALVILTATARSPDERYHSADLLARDLAAVRESRTISARRPSAATRLVRWIRREPVIASLVALLALVATLATGLATFLWMSRVELETGAAAIREVEIDAVIADVLYDEGRRSEDARELLAEHVESHPADTLARSVLAIAMLRAGDDAGAAEIAMAAPEGVEDPDALDVVRRFAQARAAGDAAAPVPAVGLATATPVEAWVHGTLELLFASDDHADTRAVQSLSLVYNTAPRARVFFDVMYMRATRRTEPGTAAGVALAILQRWPRVAAAQAAAARVLESDDPSSALRACEAALAAVPDFPGMQEKRAELIARLAAQ